jgi:Icc-related predicted phosphoesterase
MKILLIADEEDKALYDYYDSTKLKDVDLIISSGDLNPHYLEFLVTMGHAPVLYVHGNHDEGYDRKPPLGCDCIDDRVYDFHGLRILGLGGSMRYKDRKYMYTEEEMERRINHVHRDIILKNGFDILVTHAPAKGYGDMQDLPHQGFACFNKLMDRYHPKYMVHGHIHACYGNGFVRSLDHPSGTTIINAYSKYYIDIKREEYPAEGHTGSLLYDIYKNVSMARNRAHSHYDGGMNDYK